MDTKDLQETRQKNNEAQNFGLVAATSLQLIGSMHARLRSPG
jgi:hypothetical protein